MSELGSIDAPYRADYNRWMKAEERADARTRFLEDTGRLRVIERLNELIQIVELGDADELILEYADTDGGLWDPWDWGVIQRLADDRL